MKINSELKEEEIIEIEKEFLYLIEEINKTKLRYNVLTLEEIKGYIEEKIFVQKIQQRYSNKKIPNHLVKYMEQISYDVNHTLMYESSAVNHIPYNGLPYIKELLINIVVFIIKYRKRNDINI